MPSVNDDKPQFPGARSSFTEKLKFLDGTVYDPIPIYRVMNKMGKIIDADEDPGLDQTVVEKMYKCMTKLNGIDKILYESQRQVSKFCKTEFHYCDRCKVIPLIPLTSDHST